MNPVWHYLEKHEPLASPHPLFDAENYLAQIEQMPSTTLLEDYLATPNSKLPSASAVFDSQAYLNAYPDVADSNTNPLLHFLVHGLTEKRVSFVDSSQLQKLHEYELLDWLQLAPYIRPRDFLFKLIQSSKSLKPDNPATIICVARDASSSYGSRVMSKLAGRLSREGTFNVANLLLDSGDQLARFEANGSTASLEKENSVEMHTAAIQQFFLETVRLFNPIGAFVDSEAAHEIVKPLKKFDIPYKCWFTNAQAMIANTHAESNRC